VTAGGKDIVKLDGDDFWVMFLNHDQSGDDLNNKKRL